MDLVKFRRTRKTPHHADTLLDSVDVWRAKFNALKAVHASYAHCHVDIVMNPVSAASISLFEQLVASEYDAYLRYSDYKNGVIVGESELEPLAVSDFKDRDYENVLVTFVPKGASREEIESSNRAKLN